MKRLTLIACLSLFLTLSFSAFSFGLTKEEATGILKELIREDFKILEIRQSPIDDFWEVAYETGPERLIVYIHKNSRYIIHGQLLDRQIKRNLTRERLKELRRVEIPRLPLENAISMGNGKRKLYIFTNPDCHFCFQLHEELKATKDIQAFLFLYPFNLNSYRKSKAIWCSKDKLRALEEAYQGMETKSPDCNTAVIDKNMELAKILMIDSTPTIIFQNGKVIEGNIKPDILESLLKENSVL